jgi:hypothetical protein
MRTQQLIAAENIDVLMYVALPTERITVLLSMLRLAPVQVQFGIGHPLTSGSRAIDYSIVAGSMVTDARSLTAHTPLDLRTFIAVVAEKVQEVSKEIVGDGIADRNSNICACNSSSSLEESNALCMCDDSHYSRRRHFISSLSDALSFSHASPPLLHKRTKIDDTDSDTRGTATGAGEHISFSTQVPKPLRGTHYTEQLVVLDSLGYFLDNPLEFYDTLTPSAEDMAWRSMWTENSILQAFARGSTAATNNKSNAYTDSDVMISQMSLSAAVATSSSSSSLAAAAVAAKGLFDPLKYAFLSPCALIDTFLRRVNLHPVLTAYSLGNCYINPQAIVYKDERVTIQRTVKYLKPKIRLYICLQMVKKMHPSFDQVLLGILQADPSAKVLFLQRAIDILPRWVTAFKMPSDEILQRFIFVPRLNHPDYLQLVAYGSVFLNTFPYGAGITSSEALALQLPIVTLPQEVTVLHMALAQVCMYCMCMSVIRVRTYCMCVILVCTSFQLHINVIFLTTLPFHGPLDSQARSPLRGPPRCRERFRLH